jgi:hypothetical protein
MGLVSVFDPGVDVLQAIADVAPNPPWAGPGPASVPPVDGVLGDLEIGGHIRDGK